MKTGTHMKIRLITRDKEGYWRMGDTIEIDNTNFVHMMQQTLNFGDFIIVSSDDNSEDYESDVAVAPV